MFFGYWYSWYWYVVLKLIKLNYLQYAGFHYNDRVRTCESDLVQDQLFCILFVIFSLSAVHWSTIEHNYIAFVLHQLCFKIKVKVHMFIVCSCKCYVRSRLFTTLDFFRTNFLFPNFPVDDEICHIEQYMHIIDVLLKN